MGGTGLSSWTEDKGMVSLGTLGGADSFGYAISGNGSIVVGQLQNPHTLATEPFRWSATEGMVKLGAFPGQSWSTANGLSDDGSFIIGGANNFHGLVWMPDSGIRDLLDVLKKDYGLGDQLADWSWVLPRAITPDGRYILGLGVYNGKEDGWLLDRGLNPPALEQGTPIKPPPFSQYQRRRLMARWGQPCSWD